MRTGRYKLIYYYGLAAGFEDVGIEPSQPEWELFNLKEDPQEMNNVYADPDYANVVKELKSGLFRLKRELGDTDDPMSEQQGPGTDIGTG